jgi:hypothetical protein
MNMSTANVLKTSVGQSVLTLTFLLILALKPTLGLALCPVVLGLQVWLFPDLYRNRNGSLKPAIWLVAILAAAVILIGVAWLVPRL